MEHRSHADGLHRMEVASRHLTSQGVVVYSRCECGALDMSLLPWDPTAKGITTRSAA